MQHRPRATLSKILSASTEVRPEEAITALLLTLNIFVILCCYYFIKPVREALILASPDGAQYKSYASGAIAIILLFAVPAYARVARQLERNRLIISVTLFFVSNLIIFYLLGMLDGVRPYLGIPFFLWVGLFNMMIVAQFWAFANDIYSEEQGKRLFVLVGLGASLGAAFGSKLASWLIGVFGTYGMLLAAAALLALSAFLTQVVHLREKPETEHTAPRKEGGSFKLVLQHKYLLLLATFALLFTFVNTNGEYILSAFVAGEANELERAGRLGDLSKGEWIGTFYSDFYFYVNIAGLVLQGVIVSRLIKYLGFGFSFYILPMIAFAGNLMVVIFPLLSMLRITKTAENSTDYSLNNTLRNMLWLPTTQEMKYRAKQAVDTFFVRMGDVSSAILVFVFVTFVSKSVGIFALANIVLCAAWLILAYIILKEKEAFSGVNRA